MIIEYQYLRQEYDNSKDKLSTGNLPPGMSRHHIIPYFAMYEFGIIIITCFYLRYKGKNNPNEYGREAKELSKFVAKYGQDTSITGNSLIDYFKRNIYHEFFEDGNRIRVSPQEGGILKNLLRSIAWTDQNLFIGPSGKIRDDDPAQEYDKIPFSMGNNRFVEELLKERKAGIAGNVPYSDRNNGTINLENGQLKRITCTFINGLNSTNNRIYETKVGDWKAVGKNSLYPISFIKHPKNKETYDLYKLSLIEKKGKLCINEQEYIAVFGNEKEGREKAMAGAVRGKRGLEREAEEQQGQPITQYGDYFKWI